MFSCLLFKDLRIKTVDKNKFLIRQVSLKIFFINGVRVLTISNGVRVLTILKGVWVLKNFQQ